MTLSIVTSIQSHKTIKTAPFIFYKLTALQTTAIAPVKFIDNNSPSDTNVLHCILFRQGEIQMKKLFSFVMVLTVLVAVLGFNVGSASAKGPPPASTPVVVLRSPSFNNLKEEAVFVASVNGVTIEGVTIEGMTMYCRTNSKHTLKCVVPKTFAGQRVTININIDGITMSFSVKVPEIREYYPI